MFSPISRMKSAVCSTASAASQGFLWASAGLGSVCCHYGINVSGSSWSWSFSSLLRPLLPPNGPRAFQICWVTLDFSQFERFNWILSSLYPFLSNSPLPPHPLLVCLSVSRSLSVCLCLSVFVCLCLSVSLPLSVSVCLSLSLFLSVRKRSEKCNNQRSRYVCKYGSLLNAESVCPRIMVATFNGNPKTTINSCYSPTSRSDKIEAVGVYRKLQNVIRHLPNHDIIIAGDMNAQVRSEDIVGFSFYDKTNRNGNLLLDLRKECELVSISRDCRAKACVALRSVV